MTFRFRLRWRLEHGSSLKGLEQPLSVSIVPEAGECELRSVGGESRLGGQDLAIKSGPFCTKEEAQAIGEKVQAGLLLTSLRKGWGLSIQPRAPGGGVFRAGKEMLAAKYGLDTVYDDLYGLTIFEEIGSTGFAKVNEPNFCITGPVPDFVEKWGSSVKVAARWNNRILISYDLFAGSRFENSSRARFLLLIMAIEALAEQFERPNPEKKLIDILLDTIKKAVLRKDQIDSLLSGVGMLKKVSIVHACRTYLNRFITAGIVTDLDAANHFAVCYQTRGRIVHGGETPTPSVLSTDSNRLEKNIKEILIALIEGRSD